MNLMAVVRKFRCSGGICSEIMCDFYIADIRFNNCALKVNKALSTEEIATATGLNKHEVLTIMRRAIRKIKKILKEV